MRTLEGRLVGVRTFANDWCVSSLEYLNASGATVVVTVAGVMTDAIEGDRVILGGEFTTHPKFGDQFRVESFFRDVPDTGQGAVSWLIEHLPDIGPARAQVLVDKFGADLWSVLDKGELSQLTTVSGITDQRAKDIRNAYLTHRSEREAMVAYMDLGLKASEAKVLFAYVKHNKDKELDAEYFKKNPYRLFLEARCVKLERALQIGEAFGKIPHAEWHVCWVIQRARKPMSDTGATYVSDQTLSYWYRYPHEVRSDKATERAVKRGWLCDIGGGLYQLPDHYGAEISIASAVNNLLEREAEGRTN